MTAPRSVAAATCLLLCLGAGCVEKSPPPAEAPTELGELESRTMLPRPEQIAEYLGTMPTWPELQPGTPEAEAAMGVLAQVAELPTPHLLHAIHIRFAMDLLPTSDDPYHTRLFLLNRYLFNVPNDPTAHTPFVPWARGLTDPPGPCWPLGIGPDGAPILIGHFHAPDGAPYVPMAEFSFFHTQYGRRDGKP